MSRHGRELNRIIRRLERSAGRVARRNARRELDAFLKSARRELRSDFPAIGKDGVAITEQTLPMGQRRCAACGAYVKTSSDFAAHVVRSHGGKCWCGFKPRMELRIRSGTTGEKGEKIGTQLAVSPAKIVSGLRAHFNRYKEQLSAHVSIGALGADEKDE